MAIILDACIIQNLVSIGVSILMILNNISVDVGGGKINYLNSVHYSKYMLMMLMKE